MSIKLSGKSNYSISSQVMLDSPTHAIDLSNCMNITINQNCIKRCKGNGINLYKCSNVIIVMNTFEDVSTGIYADQCNNVTVLWNECKNVHGPFPRGQFAQFNTCTGGKINSNRIENILGSSYPEDAINLYKCKGTADNFIQVNGNWIRGGGPSLSGGGIMLGDNGGSFITAEGNTLVDPGQYGMAIAGGDHISMLNNKIYGKQQPFTNVGMYVDPIGGYPVTNAIVMGNQINYFNKSNYNNNWWLSPTQPLADKPVGWDGPTNTLGAKIDSTILPSQILSC